MSSEVKEFDEVFKKEEPPKQVPNPAIDEAITSGKQWKPFLSQLNDAQISEVKKYWAMNQFNIMIDGEGKTFQRRKIVTRDYRILEKLRAQHAAMRNSPERADLGIDIIQKAAEFYLGMSKEDFEASDIEEVKRIVEAQTIRSNYGVPSPTTS